MGENIIFDTHDLVKRFMLSGFNEKQSETIVSAIASAQKFDSSHLVTKSDAIQTENSIKVDIEKTEAALKTEISRIETTLGAEIVRVESKIGTEINRIESKIGTEVSRVETKLGAEVSRIESKMGVEISRVEAEIRSAIATSKNDIIKWVVGSMWAIASIIMAFIKFAS